MPALTLPRPRASHLANGLAAATMALFLVRTTALSNLLPMPLAAVDGLLFGMGESAPEHYSSIAYSASPPVLTCAAIARTVLAALALGTVCTTDRRARALAKASAVLAALLLVFALTQKPFSAFHTHTALALSVLAIGFLPRDPTHDSDAADYLTVPRISLISMYLWAAYAKATLEYVTGTTVTLLAASGAFPGPAGPFVAAHPRFVGTSGCIAELVLGLALLFTARSSANVKVAIVFAIFLFHVVLELTARPDVMGLVVMLLALSTWPCKVHKTGTESPQSSAPAAG